MPLMFVNIYYSAFSTSLQTPKTKAKNTDDVSVEGELPEANKLWNVVSYLFCPHKNNNHSRIHSKVGNTHTSKDYTIDEYDT